MKKRLFSFIAAAAVLLASVPVFASDTARLSPRATAEFDASTGYLGGFGGIPTAEMVVSQFEGDVKIIAAGEKEITGTAFVPADSAVMAGDEELAKVLVPGDASMDGKINLADVSAMLKKIAKWDNAISEASADLNNDGKLNLADVSTILKYIAKWDITLSKAAVLEIVADGAANYSILANDEATDAAFAAAVKNASGIELPIVSETEEGEKFITVGADLPEKYDFIDADAAAAVDADKAYVDIYDGNIYIVAGADGVEFAATQIAGEFDGEDLVLPRGYAGPMTHMTERSGLYWDAVERIAATKPSVDGTNGMNEDILIAISNENFTAPKNIIYMIGDGMGRNIVTATGYTHKDELFGGKMTMDYLPNRGLQSTYSSDQQITDSAAGGTALSTGHKTANGTISMIGDHSGTYKTLLELAAEKGMSTGVIATKSVTDATPATFTAHVHERGEEVEIAKQQLTKLTDGTLDLILGGGAAFYDDASNSGVMAAAKERGVTYTNDWEMAQASNLPLAGIFASHELPTDGLSNDPHIADMTDFALTMLSEDDNGFFLMVEGSKIDSYGHNNNFDAQTDETFEFDCAVAVALRFVALNPDTVLIITADHETGALSVPAEPTVDNIDSGSRYASSGHHWIDVPVYAIGYRTEELTGSQENTDIAIFTASLMGEDDFGYRSTVYDLCDLDDKKTEDAILALNKNPDKISFDGEGISVSLNSDNKYLYLPLDCGDYSPEDTMNVSAVRITFTNNSDVPRYLPSLGVLGDSTSSTSSERITYVAPGETRVYTYVIDSNMKNDGMFNSANQLVLTMRTGYIDLTITDIELVNRPFNQ